MALSGDRASLTLGSGAQLARLAVDGAGSSVSVKSGASVETLTARAAVKVDNQGAINKAEVQADNVVLDGKRPAHVEVADDVAPPRTVRARSPAPRTARNPARVAAVPAGAAAPCLRRP